MGSCFRVRFLRSKNSYDIADPYSDTYSTRESYHRTSADSSAWQLVYDGTRWTNEPVGGGSNSRPGSSGLNGTSSPVVSSPVKASPPLSDGATEAANTSYDVETYEGIDLEYEADSLTGTWDARPNHEAHEEMKQRASMILEQRSSGGRAAETHETTKQIETNDNTTTVHRENVTKPLENGVDGASDKDAGEQTTSEGDAGDAQEQTTPEVRQHESWRPVASGAYSVRFDVPDTANSDDGERTNK